MDCITEFVLRQMELANRGSLLAIRGLRFAIRKKSMKTLGNVGIIAEP